MLSSKQNFGPIGLAGLSFIGYKRTNRHPDKQSIYRCNNDWYPNFQVPTILENSSQPGLSSIQVERKFLKFTIKT